MRYQRTGWLLPEAWTARPSNNGLKNTLIHAKQRHVCATRRLGAGAIHHTARMTQVPYSGLVFRANLLPPGQGAIR